MMNIMLTVTVLSTVVSIVLALVAWRVIRDERARLAARIAALADDIHADPDDDRSSPVPIHDLFGTAPTMRGTHSGAIAGVGALVLAAAVAIVVLSGRHQPAAATGREAPAQAAARPVAAKPVPKGEPLPLELVALGHERADDRLTVRGLIRNPARGSEFSHVTAVVLVFNQQGGFVTSGRAAIEAQSLEPGAEVPFVVIVPGAADVGRYRVSFRTDDRVIPHIDRRS